MGSRYSLFLLCGLSSDRRAARCVWCMELLTKKALSAYVLSPNLRDEGGTSRHTKQYGGKSLIYISISSKKCDSPIMRFFSIHRDFGCFLDMYNMNTGCYLCPAQWEVVQFLEISRRIEIGVLWQLGHFLIGPKELQNYSSVCSKS